MSGFGTPPPLSRQERADAIARGVAARQLRAEVREGLREGRLRVADVLADGHAPDERGRVLARMRVIDLLSAFPHIGPIRAAETMERIGIAANRRVGGLGHRQVAELTDYLERRFPEGSAAPEDSAASEGPGTGGQ